MADYAIISKNLLTRIGDAIRKMRGKTGLIPAADMPDEIESIETGSDVSGVTATASDVLAPKVFVNSAGEEVTGTIATVAQATPTISINQTGLITAKATQSKGYVNAGYEESTYQLLTKSGTNITPGNTSKTAISKGFLATGNITVEGDSNLLSRNIRSGVSIFGVDGGLVEQKFAFTDDQIFGLSGVTDSKTVFFLTASVNNISAFFAEIVMNVGEEVMTYSVLYDPSYSTSTVRVFYDYGSQSGVFLATMSFDSYNNTLTITASSGGAFFFSETTGDTVQRGVGLLVYT